MARTAPDWPRMMRKSTAAAYCDLASTDFEREVNKGNLPLPVMLGGGERWSKVLLDEYLERLTGEKVPDWRARSNLYGART